MKTGLFDLGLLLRVYKTNSCWPLMNTGISTLCHLTEVIYTLALECLLVYQSYNMDTENATIPMDIISVSCEISFTSVSSKCHELTEKERRYFIYIVAFQHV